MSVTQRKRLRHILAIGVHRLLPHYLPGAGIAYARGMGTAAQIACQDQIHAGAELGLEVRNAAGGVGATDIRTGGNQRMAACFAERGSLRVCRDPHGKCVVITRQ